MRSLRIAALLAALSLVLSGAATAQWEPQIEPGTVEIPRGDLFIQDIDTVWTAAGSILEHASILIRDGIIRAIGTDLEPPRGVQTIQGSGFTAIPGLVDEHTHTGIRSTNEGTAPVVPEVRVIDVLDPHDFNIYRALSGGVTTARTLHGSANPIGGQNAVIKMRWGMEEPHQLLMEGAPKSVKFALGENVTQKNSPGSPGGARRFPTSRAGVEAIYVEAFTAAREYQRRWAEYRANPRRFRVPPRRDFRLETLVDVLEGRARVTAHSYRSDEIVMLMRVAERFGFKIDVMTHVLEGYKVADEMAAHGAAGGTFSDWWQYKLEAYDAIPYNAAIMEEHGVLTAINSDIPWLQSFMVYEFNKPVKYGGVSRENALRMLTINPARMMFIDDKVGSLEIGKHGDVVLLSGDPFDSYSRVEKTIVDGIVYYDLERETETRGEPVRALPSTHIVPETVSGATHVGMGLGIGVPAPASLVAQQSTVTALTGAIVHTVSGPDIVDGTVLIADGNITAVGAADEVAIPAGARVVALAGRHIYPGMIDPVTQLGMIEIGSVSSARDESEVGRYNPHIRALYSVHPHSEAIPVARANGITTVLTTLGGSAVIPGMGSVIQLAGDTPERMEVLDRAALMVNFPSPSGKTWDEPQLKGERVEELVALFDRAVRYAKQPSVREIQTAPFEANLAEQETILLDALVPAITGQVPTFISARTERDIRTVLLFLDRFPDVKAVLVGADQAFRVADELARRDIPVIVGSALTPTMDRDDPVAAGWMNAGILDAAGVKVSFGTGSVADVRNLPYHAAKSVAFGLPKEVGLRAVTLNAAEILGVGDILGSIDVGKRADLIVTDGDPLQIVTHVERAFINGEEVSLESKHTRLWKQFRARH